MDVVLQGNSGGPTAAFHNRGRHILMAPSLTSPPGVTNDAEQAKDRARGPDKIVEAGGVQPLGDGDDDGVGDGVGNDDGDDKGVTAVPVVPKGEEMEDSAVTSSAPLVPVPPSDPPPSRAMSRKGAMPLSAPIAMPLLVGSGEKLMEGFEALTPVAPPAKGCTRTEIDMIFIANCITGQCRD